MKRNIRPIESFFVRAKTNPGSDSDKNVSEIASEAGSSEESMNTAFCIENERDVEESIESTPTGNTTTSATESSNHSRTTRTALKKWLDWLLFDNSRVKCGASTTIKQNNDRIGLATASKIPSTVLADSIFSLLELLIAGFCSRETVLDRIRTYGLNRHPDRRHCKNHFLEFGGNETSTSIHISEGNGNTRKLAFQLHSAATKAQFIAAVPLMAKYYLRARRGCLQDCRESWSGIDGVDIRWETATSLQPSSVQPIRVMEEILSYTDYSAAFYMYDVLLAISALTVMLMPLGVKLPAENIFTDLLRIIKLPHFASHLDLGKLQAASGSNEDAEWLNEEEMEKPIEVSQSLNDLAPTNRNMIIESVETWIQGPCSSD
uniref:Uncharacterized protein n=1 Tax=Timema cristinae TaxID=61476 RepID=A0A7R9CIE0_TIMCR|nr:unnamed protein product [Timema cristinae]